MKRIVEIISSFFGLLILSPLLVTILLLVWLQDWANPLYMGDRIGMGGRPFKMVKIRSMIVNADKTGVESTGSSDNRITAVGQFVRNWKLDEISQLWNVLTGDMSLVGPRPNTAKGVSVYTQEERKLLTVRPGITDLSSIVFSDEGEILKDAEDPDARYDQLIRPWKSRLSLFCIENSSLILDFRLIWLTLVAIFDKRRALEGVASILGEYDAQPDLVVAARRNTPLDQLVGQV